MKSILNPGNGVTFGKYGDYIRFDLIKYTSTIENKDKTKNLLQNTGNSEEYKDIIIRFGFESNIKQEIVDLIKEMSLFEKCKLEIEVKNNEIDVFEIEIKEINTRFININHDN